MTQPSIAMETNLGALEEAARFVRSQCRIRPETIAITLGSGLGAFAERVERPIAIDAADIPHFPAPSVAGHQGQLIVGELRARELSAPKPVLLVKGRVHLYEGRPLNDIVFYVRLLHLLGVRRLILTNAAGGVNPQFNAGDLCLITELLNLMMIPFAATESVAVHEPLFDEELQTLARNAALAEQIRLREGAYAGVLGPSYETKAEIRMLQTLRADLVGMSTVYEALVAKSLGIQVLGISLVTNKAAGLSDEILSHDDVQSVAKRAQFEFSRLIEKIVQTCR
jgi:purine-nucleoside phosphorylase